MEERKIKRDNSTKSECGNTMKYKQSEKETFLKHRVNGALEYKINGEYLNFQAYERKKIDRQILESRDFEKIKKYFTIEEG